MPKKKNIPKNDEIIDDKNEILESDTEEPLSEKLQPGPGSLDATQMYMSEIGYSPLLSPEQEIHYGRLVQQGDENARAMMIVSNLRLVVKIARRYYNRGLDFSDLIEEGNLGLMHAVEKYDPARGFRFSTYATWWIRQSIEHAIQCQSRTIRLPVHVVKELNKYLHISKELMKTLEQEPSYQQIADAVHKPVEDVIDIMELNERTVSLDAMIGNESHGGRTLLDSIANPKESDPAQLFLDENFYKNLERWLGGLNEKQREVIARRFGLENHDRHTLEEVSQVLGISREHVRQLQVHALHKLRELMLKEGITGDEME